MGLPTVDRHGPGHLDIRIRHVTDRRGTISQTAQLTLMSAAAASDVLI